MRLAGQNYWYILGVFSVSIGVLAFVASLTIGEQINFYFYKMNFKRVQKQFSTGKDIEKLLKKLPIEPGQIKLSFGLLYVVFGVGIGIAFAIMANDVLITPIVFVCMCLIGYSYYRGQASDSYVKNRSYFIEILRVFSSNLETYQSVSRSFEELWSFYKGVEGDQKDVDFQRKLKTLVELMPQGEELEKITDRVFGSDKVYQHIPKIVTVAVTSGLSDAVGYCNDLIVKISEWKSLVTLMNSQVSSLKFAALILELLFISSVGATLLPDWGPQFNNIFRMFFFSAENDQRMFFALILVAHTIVQLGFIEFLKIQSESI